MKKGVYGWGLLVMVLVFGMTVVGCDNVEDEYEDEDKNPTLTGTVSISGTAMVGETLTANTVNVGGSYSTSNYYQWKRDKTTDIGTGRETYYVQSDDIGSTITVTVKNSRYSGSVTSAPTEKVVAAIPSLGGSISLDNYYPIRSETITATFNASSSQPVGTPTWKWYKTNDASTDLSNITNKTQVGSNASYTVSISDESAWLWVEISYSGNKGTVSKRISSPVIAATTTANVSVSMIAKKDDRNLLTTNDLIITLSLSAGRWNNNGITTSIVNSWITMGGSSAGFIDNYVSKSVSAQGRELVIKYTWSLIVPETPNFTATLETSQLNTMRSYTNVSSTLSAGTPTTASTSQWVSAY